MTRKFTTISQQNGLEVQHVTMRGRRAVDSLDLVDTLTGTVVATAHPVGTRWSVVTGDPTTSDRKILGLAPSRDYAATILKAVALGAII